MPDELTVWVFNGSGVRRPYNFPSAVFTDPGVAEEWILKHSASGILTQYPLNIGVYDWAIARGSFRPTKAEHHTPAFIETFSSAYQTHYHYEGGKRVAG